MSFSRMVSAVVLAMSLNSGVGSTSSSTPNWSVATDLTTRKTRTVRNGPVLPPIIRHVKFHILAPIKYLTSDHTMTWSVRTLCSFIHCLTSRCQMCDPNNTRWVAIENPPISLNIRCYFTMIQQILVWLQIWKREVEERPKLPNLRNHHVMIRWGLSYIIGAKGTGTVKGNRGAGTTLPKNCRLMSGLGNNSTKTTQVGIIAGSGTETEPNCWSKPGPLAGYPDPLLTLLGCGCWLPPAENVFQKGTTGLHSNTM